MPSQTYCHATLSVALREIERVAVRVGEKGQFEHALVDDRSLEHNATLRERRNHVLDGLINRQPDGDTTCSPGCWLMLAGRVKTELESLASIDGGPVIPRPELQPQTECLDKEGNGGVHVRDVDRRVPTADHADIVLPNNHPSKPWPTATTRYQWSKRWSRGAERGKRAHLAAADVPLDPVLPLGEQSFGCARACLR